MSDLGWIEVELYYLRGEAEKVTKKSASLACVPAHIGIEIFPMQI
jgi:hypothetical protein